mgnify:CR=1 FL=1
MDKFDSISIVDFIYLTKSGAYIPMSIAFEIKKQKKDVDNVLQEVTDFYEEKTVFESVPYEVCSNQKQPVYEEVLRDNDPGAFVGGAIVGGILGKAITDKEGGAALGAIIGGTIANESQKSQTRTKIIGHTNEIVCRTKFKKIPENFTQYSHSTISFLLEGREYTIDFNKN